MFKDISGNRRGFYQDVKLLQLRCGAHKVRNRDVMVNGRSGSKIFVLLFIFE